MSKPSTRWQLKKKRQLIITEGGVTEQIKKESKKTKMVNYIFCSAKQTFSGG